MNSPNPTRISLCGRLSVELEGRKIEADLPGRQGRLVLAYMALNRDRSVNRDELIDALWPGAPPADPRETLSALIAKLRRALGEGVLDGRRDLTLRLPADAWIDVEVARAAVRDAESATERGDWRSAWGSSQAALEALDGELLAGDESDWLEGARGRLEELRMGALECLATAGLGRGGSGVGAAERAARELVALAPYRESGHRLLIQAFAASGNYAEGLRAYDRLRLLLRDELGAVPGAEIQALHRTLLAQPDPRAEAVESREETKLVTVLAAELAEGSTVGTRSTEEIEGLGGAVVAKPGASTTAVFGMPAAREDDAERAVRAALRLRDLGIARRAGVASGEALVSPAGSAEGEVFAAAGELARVESGTVLVDELTIQLTRHAIRFAGAAPAREAVAPVTGTPAAATSPFVGRDHELAMLAGFHRATAGDGQPRLVLILGDAGVGKTRLADELIRAVAPRGEVLRGRCLSHGQGAYEPLREILWDAAGIALADSAETAVEKLGALTTRLFAGSSQDPTEAESTRFALALTAGLAIEDNPLEEMSPETVADELGVAWPRFLSARAGEHATTVLVEDLHWAEPQLLAMLERIAARSSGRLLILATARPQFAEEHPGWAAGSRISQIALEPLNEESAGELLERLLPDVEPGVRARVAAAGEGNPFFIEEITRLLNDRGDLEGVAIPSTVRALLAARIDALPETEKQALQDAAVLGRRFWRAPLESATRGAGLGEVLESLERKGLVAASPTTALPDQAEFAFRHALTREVAYLSIPADRRRRAHAATAEWLEEILGERREEFVELIAYHREAAASSVPVGEPGRDDARRRALDALAEAADAAQHRSETDAAAAFAERALPFADDGTGRLQALELLARAHHSSVRGNAAFVAYRDAIEVAGTVGDPAAVARLRAGLALLGARYAGGLSVEGWERLASENVEAGLEELDDGARTFEVGALLIGRASIPRWLGADLEVGAGGRADIERAVEIAEEIDSSHLLAHAIEALAQFNVQTGFCEAAGLAERLLAAGARLPDPLEATESRVDATLLFVRAGQFERAAGIADDVSRQASRLTSHRRLHAAGAQTTCLVPLGDFPKLLDETDGVPDLVRAEGGRTCPIGALALAGHALALHETASGTQAADAAAQLSEAAAPRGRGPALRYMAVEVLRPIIGAEAARAQIGRIESSPSAVTKIFRLRIDLQLAVLGEEWDRVDELRRDARERARTSCAPALAWIADWASAMRHASEGRSAEAASAAMEATDSLEGYGERYTASRLLVDLLPRLDDGARRDLAERASNRLAAMGARASADEAEKFCG